MEQEQKPFSWSAMSTDQLIAPGIFPAASSHSLAADTYGNSSPNEPESNASAPSVEASFVILELDHSCSVRRDDDYVGIVTKDRAASFYVFDDYDEPDSLSKKEASQIDQEFNEAQRAITSFVERLGFIRLPDNIRLQGVLSTKRYDLFLGICPQAGVADEEWIFGDGEFGFDPPHKSDLIRDFHTNLCVSTNDPLDPLPTLDQVYEAIKQTGLRRKLYPAEDETLADWIQRVGIPASEVKRQAALFERVGYDIELYDLADKPKDEEIQFVVPGLIPRGMVGLLIGGHQIGKSTLLDELCAKLECNLPGVMPEFLGIPLTGGMTTVFLSGEDPISIFSQRRSTLAKTWGEGSGLVIDATTRSFSELLALIRRIPKIDLIVLDPARRFIVGDEDSSSNVSAFFQELVALAQEKNCAIMVVQHGKKGHQPRSLKEISPRGSGVFLDRPRFVLGMFQNADGSIGIGLLKHNIPTGVPMWELGKARYFTRDPDTLSLEPIGAAPAASHRAAPAVVQDDATLEAVWDAVARLNTQGETVQQTGKRELFQLNLPHLAGLSRATLRAATTKLVEIGRLEHGPTGLIAKHTNLQ